MHSLIREPWPSRDRKVASSIRGAADRAPVFRAWHHEGVSVRSNAIQVQLAKRLLPKDDSYTRRLLSADTYDNNLLVKF